VFRLDKKPGDERTCLAIDCEISSECIEVIETCCDHEMAHGKPVDLFLRDVINVDDSGRALLSRLAAKGVRLLANGVYASYLVENANRTVSGPLIVSCPTKRCGTSTISARRVADRYAPSPQAGPKS